MVRTCRRALRMIFGTEETAMTTDQAHTSGADLGTGRLTRRGVLRSGVAGLAVAGAGALGLGQGAAYGASARLASVGSAAGLSWTGWSTVAPGLTTQRPFACAQS